MTWPFGNLQPGHYGAIISDPPWRFSNFSAKGEGKNPVQHYGCMSIADIAALPVANLAAKDCALMMWATAPLMHEAIALMGKWGFTYKSTGAWAKQSSTGTKWAFGTGYILRSASEFWLIGTRGKPRVKSRGERNLIVAPVREHSRKPDDQYRKMEALFDGPYAELFSRSSRPGWATFGNEAGKFDGVLV